MIFVLFDFLILLFFYYFTVIFCHVYHKTQVSWIIDSIVSIIIGFIIELLIILNITIIYFMSMKYNKEVLYKVVLFST